MNKQLQQLSQRRTKLVRKLEEELVRVQSPDRLPAHVRQRIDSKVSSGICTHLMINTLHGETHQRTNLKCPQEILLWSYKKKRQCHSLVLQNTEKTLNGLDFSPSCACPQRILKQPCSAA